MMKLSEFLSPCSRPRPQKAFGFLASCLLCLVLGGRAQGQVITSLWLGDVAAGPGNWNNGLLWSVLPLTGYNVTISNGLLFPSVVNQNVDATVAQLTVGSGATLAIGDTRSLTLTGNAAIDGTLSLNASSGVSELVASGALVLSGNGTVTLGANAGNRIRAAGSSDSLTNQATIQGGGSIGLGLLAISNQGTIVANAPGVPLVLAPNSSGATNSGTLRATGGATLTLQSGAFNNDGGVVEAQNGSTVRIASSSLASGNLTIADNGVLELSGATLTNVNVTNSSSGIVRALSGVNSLFGLYADALGSQVRAADGARIALPGGAGGVTINGGIYLDSTGTDTVLEIAAGGFPVSGAGRLVLSNNVNNRVIGSGSAPTVTFGSAFTVEGAGKLGDGLLGIVNQGMILANRSNPLTVQPSSAGFTNTGTLRATGGGTLLLAGGTFTNTGGTIEAQNASTVQLASPTVSGGTLGTSGSGTIDITSTATLQNVTLLTGSNLNLLNASVATLLGTLTNNGTLSLKAVAAATDLKISGAVSIGGTGSIVLGDSSLNRVFGGGGGDTLTLGASQTLSGAGELGRDQTNLVNLGTIVANGTNPLVINNNGSAFTNQGTLRATGSGGLTLADATVTNQGKLEIATASSLTAASALVQTGANSATQLSGGTLSASTFSLNNGTLSGYGTINGAVSMTGGAAILPGGAGAVGTLTFNQAFTLGPSTGIYFDLGGTTAGTGYDRINGTTVTLGGNLHLTFVNGFQFTIAPTDTLTLIGTSTALSGTFSGLANGARLATTDGLGTFQVNYLANSFTLSDFQAVPEPSTYALLGLGAIAVFLTERRRRRSAR